MARASARRSQTVGRDRPRAGRAGDDREGKHSEGQEEEDAVDRELGARASPAHPMRVDVPGEEDGLEEEDADGPGGRRASHAGQEHSRDHRLDDEEETGAEEDGDCPEETHRVTEYSPQPLPAA